MKTAIVGLWTLVSWDRAFADGSSEPYCDGPVGGILHYGANGHMSVSLYQTDQPRILSTYGGSYECLGQDAIHYPVAGYSPDGIDKPKRRRLAIAGRTMHMESAWREGSGPTYKHKLVWQRSTT